MMVFFVLGLALASSFAPSHQGALSLAKRPTTEQRTGLLVAQTADSLSSSVRRIHFAPGTRALRTRRLRRLYRAVPPGDPPCLTSPENGTIDMWVYDAPDGTRWGAIGVNRSEAAAWLHYEGHNLTATQPRQRGLIALGWRRREPRWAYKQTSGAGAGVAGGGVADGRVASRGVPGRGVASGDVGERDDNGGEGADGALLPHMQTPRRLWLLRARDGWAQRSSVRAKRLRPLPLASAALAASKASASGLRCESLRLSDRSTHRRLSQMWRARRLLLHGVSLSKLALHGRLHAPAARADALARRGATVSSAAASASSAAAIVATAAASASAATMSTSAAAASASAAVANASAAAASASLRSRLLERDFRREVLHYVRRTRQLESWSSEARALVAFVRAHSPVALGSLQRSTVDRCGVRASLDAWRSFLHWFREAFPYERGVCGACGEAEACTLLGNVRASGAEARMGGARRAELRTCGACGALTRFARHERPSAVLGSRRGRCGEYAALLLVLARALGWRARLVVDWTDHVWIEVLVPDEGDDGARSDGEASDGDASDGDASDDGQRAGVQIDGGNADGLADTPSEALASTSPLTDPLYRAVRPSGGQLRSLAPRHRLLPRVVSRRLGKRGARRRRRASAESHRWVALDPCEAAVDEPRLYASWGKTHTHVVALGDGDVVDVTPTYARDWEATTQARDLSEEQIARSLAWARRLPRTPWR